MEKGLGMLRIPGYTETEREFTPPSAEEMLKQCLHLYLEPHKKILLNETGYPQNFRLKKFVREIKHIFEQHETPVVQHKQSTYTLVTIAGLKEVRRNV